MFDYDTECAVAILQQSEGGSLYEEIQHTEVGLKLGNNLKNHNYWEYWVSENYLWDSLTHKFLVI